jgi:hypothetical protein
VQAYLEHRNIQHTVRYTELSPNRFKDFWRWRRERSFRRPTTLNGLFSLLAIIKDS